MWVEGMGRWGGGKGVGRGGGRVWVKGVGTYHVVDFLFKGCLQLQVLIVSVCQFRMPWYPSHGIPAMVCMCQTWGPSGRSYL